MVEVRPTILNFSEPMKTLEELIINGKLKHDGNPVMEWMISNVVCHRDQKDNIYPRKEFPQNKIDGPVAAIMALSRAMVFEGGYDSIYNYGEL
jgi:phage terminase large subunit-like protein